MHPFALPARRLYSLAIILCAMILGFYLSAAAVQAKPSTVYNVKTDFYAAGNGTTDDTAAIVAAFNTANLHPGSTVLFPAGTYLIATGSTYIPVTGVTMLGQGATINITGSGSYFYLSGHNAACENLIFTGNGDQYSIGLYPYYGSADFLISGCTFSNFLSPIYVYSGAKGTIESNTFNVLPADYGVNIQYNGKTTIANNTFTATTSGSGYGINSSGPYATGIITATGNTFTDLSYGIYAKGIDYQGKLVAQSNTFTDCYYGVYPYEVGVVNVSSNTMNSCTYPYYDYACASTVISDNTISSPYCGIYSYYTYGSAKITGNTITNPSAEGIYDYYDYALQINKNTVTGGTNAYGIYDYYSANVQITNNTLSSQGYGIYSYYSDGVLIQKNGISNEQNSGIYAYEARGYLTINGNPITDVGLTTANAVIDVESGVYAPASPITISKNTYSGNTGSMSYFIYENTGTAVLSGNKTTTLLPDYPVQP